MDEKTRRALGAINRRFYRESADAFSRTRREPWPGWERLTPLLRAQPADRPLRVLDVGCGNGRFGAYLADALPDRRAGIRYQGIDASEELLAALRARRLPLGGVTARRLDLVEDAVDDLGGPFSLIAAIGVLHHVPGRDRRLALLRALAAQLAPGGLLVLAFWRFGEFERFRARQIPWSRFNADAAEPVDPRALEPGDCLLAWGPGTGTPRYCHFADAGEIESLVAALSLRSVADFTDDGRDRDLNRYFVLQAWEEG